VTGGEDDAVEVVQNGLLDLLAGRRGDRNAADPRADRTVRRDADVDRCRHEARRMCGALLFPLLLAAESRHRFPHSHASGVERTARSGSMVLPPAVGFPLPRRQDPFLHVLLSLSGRSRFSRHRDVTDSSQDLALVA
jgi:hypothetical protein